MEFPIIMENNKHGENKMKEAKKYTNEQLEKTLKLAISRIENIFF